MADGHTISLSVKPNFTEYYLGYFRWTLRRFRRTLIILAAVNIFLAAILLYASNNPSLEFDSAKTIEGMRPWFLFTILAIIIVPLLPFIVARKAVRDPRGENGYKYKFSPDGVEIEGAVGRSVLDWKAFTNAREDSAAFLLFVNREQFHLIPKRCFATMVDISTFREILHEKFPKAKSLRST